MIKRIATCCCEKSQLTTSGEPMISGLCHCNNCKKRTGSAFGLSAYFHQSDVIIGSELKTYEVNAETGKQERFFCPNCGTTLYWTTTAIPNYIGIASGCFVDTPLDAPQFMAMKENQCSWLDKLEDINTPLTQDDLPLT